MPSVKGSKCLPLTSLVLNGLSSPQFHVRCCCSKLTRLPLIFSSTSTFSYAYSHFCLQCEDFLTTFNVSPLIVFPPFRFAPSLRISVPSTRTSFSSGTGTTISASTTTSRYSNHGPALVRPPLVWRPSLVRSPLVRVFSLVWSPLVRGPSLVRCNWLVCDLVLQSTTWCIISGDSLASFFSAGAAVWQGTAPKGTATESLCRAINTTL